MVHVFHLFVFHVAAEVVNDFTFDPEAVKANSELINNPVQHVQLLREENPARVTLQQQPATITMETLIESEAGTESEIAVSQIEAAVAGETVQTLELQPDQIAQLLANQGSVLQLNDGTTIGGSETEQVVYYITG